MVFVRSSDLSCSNRSSYLEFHFRATCVPAIAIAQVISPDSAGRRPRERSGTSNEYSSIKISRTPDGGLGHGGGGGAEGGEMHN